MDLGYCKLGITVTNLHGLKLTRDPMVKFGTVVNGKRAQLSDALTPTIARQRPLRESSALLDSPARGRRSRGTRLPRSARTAILQRSPIAGIREAR